MSYKANNRQACAKKHQVARKPLIVRSQLSIKTPNSCIKPLKRSYQQKYKHKCTSSSSLAKTATRVRSQPQSRKVQLKRMKQVQSTTTTEAINLKQEAFKGSSCYEILGFLDPDSIDITSLTGMVDLFSEFF
ncbi:7330_t:CDS:1 [Acaulospora morrowiae]|uniref:7330_t:CDS:1 n=1 Tax=Acaulospora morrowiae TaxID=94023 RepID=A0A9N8VVL0_9GLOM|nr:7330_t:CDS:1 [Acaulospora morrowiae]